MQYRSLWSMEWEDLWWALVAIVLLVLVLVYAGRGPSDAKKT